MAVIFRCTNPAERMLFFEQTVHSTYITSRGLPSGTLQVTLTLKPAWNYENYNLKVKVVDSNARAFSSVWLFSSNMK
jgi:hypothetical protein